ncbi:vWA domain-containing protein [Natronolimnohabitans innermongolicus]|uniref:Chloride channel n=1 Tax=Natronolimnohabitans innermongolicus JCM 12255 TaxID=1227499 RepID=L9WTS7_9EURY|nr:VWA domain-containing protein [Natronolimnohabitans innermongolicus]ELY51738.1 chloride channel [Natronolimnohabitans innermongolicus JCM 12255]
MSLTTGVEGRIRGTTNGTETGSYTELDSDRFPAATTIAWIVDRFVQVHAADSPVVGHELETTGVAIETIGSRDEYSVISDRFNWDDFDYSGKNAFSSLLSAVAWPLSGSASFPDGFFDEYELVWLTGVTADAYRTSIDQAETETMSMPSDRLFYSIYGHAPFVFAAVPTDQSPEPGSVVDLTATVRHTGEDDSELAATSGGGYLDVEEVTTKGVRRTPNEEWDVGDAVSFTGLQQHPRPTVTTAATDAEYEDDLPRPVGGSIVTKRGTATEVGADTGGDGVRHELESRDHEILVGDTIPIQWDEHDAENETELTNGPVNISLVVDTSGSMRQRDAGRADADGPSMTRLEALKKDLIQVIDLIEEEYRVSLVEFNSNASVVEPHTEFDDATREQFKESVRSLSAGGQTTIGGGMARGLETIVDEPGPKTMLLLSDGAENQRPYVDDVLPDFRNQGVPVHTIGIGSAIDAEQLEYIADQTGGQSEIDFDVNDLREFYFDLTPTAQLRSELSRVDGTLDEDDFLEDNCQVDSSCDDAQFALSYEGSEMVLTVTDPDGNEITEGDGISHRVGDAHEVWSIDDPPTGEWHYEVDVRQVDAPQKTFVQSTSDSTVDGELYVTSDLYEATGYVRLQLVVSEGLERYTGARARAEIVPPEGDDEDAEVLTLYDDGSGPDDVSGDGIYTNYYHPTETGTFDVRTIIEGGKYDELRREFTHTAEIATVVDDPIQPWEDRSPATDSETDESLLERIPLAGVVGASALGAGWWYYRNHAGDDADDGVGNDGGPDGAAGASPQVDEDAAADDGEAEAETDDEDTNELDDSVDDVDNQSTPPATAAIGDADASDREAGDGEDR